MKNSISYKELSGEIKREVERFLDGSRNENRDMTMEEAALLWFDRKFDAWMLEKYNRSRKCDRKHFRFDIEIPVKVVERLIDSDSRDSEELDYVGTILNISRGGFYFKSAENINPSSIIRVIIDLSIVDPDLRGVEALAMVIRSDRINDSHGVGVMFSSIYDEDRKNLDVFIFKNVAYHFCARAEE